VIAAIWRAAEVRPVLRDQGDLVITEDRCVIVQVTYRDHGVRVIAEDLRAGPSGLQTIAGFSR
jgi:hypothetical protein